ncbi:MAG: hypothetical protein NTX61_03785 [Bacteroidetes bacterium]|nr:hypothetical protein [Bacteroidota bacterium]
MKNLIRNLILLLILVFINQCRTTGVSSNMDGLFQNSDFIFQGKILKMNETNFPGIQKSEKTLIVKVTKIIQSSKDYEDFVNNDVTVVLPDDKKYSLQEGSEYIYFTKIWLIGKTLATKVNEVETSIQNFEQVKNNLTLYQEKTHQDTLKKRVTNANVVALGKILEVKDAEDKRPPNESEHNPTYRIATLQIEELLKGDIKEKRIDFFFSDSYDIRWYKSPKFKVDDQGVFLLSRVAEIKGIKNPLLLTDPLDKRDRSDLELIRKTITNK